MLLIGLNLNFHQRPPAMEVENDELTYRIAVTPS
jgi:hypothetical protein